MRSSGDRAKSLSFASILDHEVLKRNIKPILATENVEEIDFSRIFNSIKTDEYESLNVSAEMLDIIQDKVVGEFKSRNMSVDQADCKRILKECGAELIVKMMRAQALHDLFDMNGDIHADVRKKLNDAGLSDEFINLHKEKLKKDLFISYMVNIAGGEKLISKIFELNEKTMNNNTGFFAGNELQQMINSENLRLFKEKDMVIDSHFIDGIMTRLGELSMDESLPEPLREKAITFIAVNLLLERIYTVASDRLQAEEYIAHTKGIREAEVSYPVTYLFYLERESKLPEKKENESSIEFKNFPINSIDKRSTSTMLKDEHNEETEIYKSLSFVERIYLGGIFWAVTDKFIRPLNMYKISLAQRGDTSGAQKVSDFINLITESALKQIDPNRVKQALSIDKDSELSKYLGMIWEIELFLSDSDDVNEAKKQYSAILKSLYISIKQGKGKVSFSELEDLFKRQMNTLTEMKEKFHRDSENAPFSDAELLTHTPGKIDKDKEEASSAAEVIPEEEAPPAAKVSPEMEEAVAVEPDLKTVDQAIQSLLALYQLSKQGRGNQSELQNHLNNIVSLSQYLPALFKDKGGEADGDELLDTLIRLLGQYYKNKTPDFDVKELYETIQLKYPDAKINEIYANGDNAGLAWYSLTNLLSGLIYYSNQHPQATGELIEYNDDDAETETSIEQLESDDQDKAEPTKSLWHLPRNKPQADLRSACNEYLNHLKKSIYNELLDSEIGIEKFGTSDSAGRLHFDINKVIHPDDNVKNRIEALGKKNVSFGRAIEKYNAISEMRNALIGPDGSPMLSFDSSEENSFKSIFYKHCELIKTHRDSAAIKFLKHVIDALSFGIATIAGIWKVKGKEEAKKISDILDGKKPRTRS